MKTSFSLLCFFYFFSFSGFGQVVDTAAVVREVDSLIQVSRTLMGKNDFDKALEANAAAEKLALEKLGRVTAAYGSVCFNHGRVLSTKGDYSEAEKWYLESKAIREKVLGKEHADYAQNLHSLAILYTKMNHDEKAEPLYLEVIPIREKVLGRGHADYAHSLSNLGVLYWRAGKYEKAEPLHLEAKSIREKVLGTEHPDYAHTLNNLASVYTDMGKYEKAEPLHLEAKAIREKVLGKEHPSYAQTVGNLASLYFKMGDYEKVEPLLLEAKDIREKKFGAKHFEYAQSLNSLATLYMNMGNYEKAEPLYLESKDIREGALGKENPAYALSLNNLAALYMSMGNYEKAVSLNLETIAIREKTLGKEHPDYATSLNNLALLYRNMGNYEKAEPLYLESMAIRGKRLGKEHPDYSASLNNLAILYKNLGNYEKAEPLYLEAKTIREKVLGKEHPEYAQTLGNLANMYGDMGNYEKAESLYLETKAIQEKVLGKEHPEYGANLSNLAVLYWKMGSFQKAELFHFEALTVREKALGKEHPEYATSLINMAALYLKMGNYKKAEPLYLEAKAIQEKVLGKEHFEYVDGLHNLGILFWTTGDLDAAKSFFMESEEIDKSLLIKATQSLSERELTLYTIKFVNRINQNFSFTQIQPAVTPTCYDNTLFYKGFLLNAVSEVSKLVQTNPTAVESYNRLKSYHRRLAAEYAKPIAERKNVAELEEKANTLEKELTRTVAGFGAALRQVNWQEVQAVLKPGEVAIEFIRFHYHNPNPTDSTLYAALLVKPGMASPAFISLFEEKQLATLRTPLAEQGSSGLNELYGGQTGQSLHRLLWSPIEPHLAGIKTVYYSPSGLMHRLNIGAMPVAEGKILADRHELVCLSSTRQLVTSSAYTEAMAGKNSTAVVYGGIQFDMDSTAYPVQRNLKDDDFNNRRGLSFGQTDSTLRLARRNLGKGGGDSWQYLKWSEKEADNVQNILAKANIATETRKGWQATEESFKQIGKDKLSPRILHISTHGFFFPDPKSAVNRGPSSVDSEPVFKISDHPMIRAGLVLAGGNHAWKTGKPLGNREDGILTAYEISQLDLRNTDLVVLSACETGLGQIEGNEGVYGLQRAFKIAGAKNLVMSLWQVPDYQTQELMTAFYRNMLEGKMPVRQALHAAQDEMRQKRYEPFYWAGFILVE